MKIRDVFKLSSRKFRTSFRRNILAIATLSVLFVIALAINIWLQGLRNAYIFYAGEATHGRTIISAVSTNNTTSSSEPMNHEDIVKDIEYFGGKVLSDKITYSSYGSIILNRDLVNGAIETNLEELPAATTPILISSSLSSYTLGVNIPPASRLKTADQWRNAYVEYRKRVVGQTFVGEDNIMYCVVGLAPGSSGPTNLSLNKIEQDGFNPLNALLRLVPTPGATQIALEEEGRPITIQNESQSILAVFDSAARALEYLENGQAIFPNIDFPGRHYKAQLIAGPSPETLFIIHIISFFANFFSLVLVVVATIITAFTSIRLIDLDKYNITLYRNLGATTKQIRVLYSAFFLQLMVGVVLLSFCLATIIVFLFCLLNQKTLSVLFLTAFSLPSEPFVLFYGINFWTFLFIILALSAAPLCVFINRRRLR